jgi:glyoxylase-like metal-dependent hydrolase (beta-lactamase superfamily II)
MKDIEIKALSELLSPSQAKHPKPDKIWQVDAVVLDDCLSYVLWNDVSHEWILVDPKVEAIETYQKYQKKLDAYVCLGVLDTHTHADHISCAAKLAQLFQAPLIMHHLSGSSQVDCRISRNTQLRSHAGPMRFILTPGHTTDSMTITWGPFVLTGDTVLFNDAGRDDLPEGNANAHYDSLDLLKRTLEIHLIMLPGHDHQGGRASSWDEQLKLNPALQQSREEFLKESLEFDAPAPKQFKKALYENTK